MNERVRSTAYQRFLAAVTAMTLLGALGGGLVLVLRGTGAGPPARVAFIAGSAPGTVALLGMLDPGGLPFTEPVAVDLAIDPLELVLPPLSAESARSPHRPGSAADRLVAARLAHSLVAARDSGLRLEVGRVSEIAADALGIDGVVQGLLDVDGDGLDDDRQFTVTAVDGSAVCVRLGDVRQLVVAQRLAVDPVDGASATGIDWSPYGPCSSQSHDRTRVDLRVGTTPGTYGGVRSGEVCDVAALVAALTSHEVVTGAWSAVHSIDPDGLEAFVATLTPVILLRDTLATDHGFSNGRIRPRQVILERGTAVLVDATGVPRVRCMSGSPLRRPQALTDDVVVLGQPWHGFALAGVVNVGPAPSPTHRFVLVDITTGSPLRRDAGADGASASLAGPLVSIASGAGNGG